MKVAPVQLATPQLVLGGAYWHAPAPSQRPVKSHWPPGVHRFSPSFSPAGIGWHEPAFPATAQEKHVPQVATPQQTPSTQLVLSHSVLATHCWPSRFFPHAPPMQNELGAQSESPPQAAKQVVPLHA